MVTRISTNILCARSKSVSEPAPTKNFGLKFFEKGILKFSGPQPKRIVLGLSPHPLRPACQAQKRVWTVGEEKDKLVTLLRYPEFLTNEELPNKNEKATNRNAKLIKDLKAILPIRDLLCLIHKNAKIKSPTA